MTRFADLSERARRRKAPEQPAAEIPAPIPAAAVPAKPDQLPAETGRRMVSVGTGDTAVSVTVEPRYGWLTQLPPWGSLGAGPAYESMFAALDITRSLLTDVISGGPTIPVDPLADFKDFRYNLTLHEAFVDVPIGLPRWSVAPLINIHPAVNVGFGGNSVKLEQDTPGSANTTLRGTGYSLRAGAELAITLPAGFFTRVKYGYGYGWSDVDRSGSETTGFVPGPPAPTARFSEDGELSWHSHKASAQVGINLMGGLVATYLGLGYLSWKGELDTTNKVQVFGTTNVARHVRQEFEHKNWHGQVGVEGTPLAGFSKALDPLFVRAEAQIGCDFVGVLVKAIYHFDLWQQQDRMR